MCTDRQLVNSSNIENLRIYRTVDANRPRVSESRELLIHIDRGCVNKKNISDLSLLFELFSNEKIIRISDQEMYDLNCNLFSISDDVIVSDIGFTRVNNILKNRGFIVEEINFSKISKLGGLFRCSTLPLKRK